MHWITCVLLVGTCDSRTLVDRYFLWNYALGILTFKLSVTISLFPLVPFSADTSFGFSCLLELSCFSHLRAFHWPGLGELQVDLSQYVHFHSCRPGRFLNVAVDTQRREQITHELQVSCWFLHFRVVSKSLWSRFLIAGMSLDHKNTLDRQDSTSRLVYNTGFLCSCTVLHCVFCRKCTRQWKSAACRCRNSGMRSDTCVWKVLTWRNKRCCTCVYMLGGADVGCSVRLWVMEACFYFSYHFVLSSFSSHTLMLPGSICWFFVPHQWCVPT